MQSTPQSNAYIAVGAMGYMPTQPSGRLNSSFNPNDRRQKARETLSLWKRRHR